mmetsp:Transcript_55301/g.131913  ORF Transcript_55301/g.131913 Transcript_55301/m.131913 type:complete len:662 (+) Transcript_55301:55-2040(+)
MAPEHRGGGGAWSFTKSSSSIGSSSQVQMLDATAHRVEEDWINSLRDYSSKAKHLRQMGDDSVANLVAWLEPAVRNHDNEIAALQASHSKLREEMEALRSSLEGAGVTLCKAAKLRPLAGDVSLQPPQQTASTHGQWSGRTESTSSWLPLPSTPSRKSRSLGSRSKSPASKAAAAVPKRRRPPVEGPGKSSLGMASYSSSPEAVPSRVVGGCVHSQSERQVDASCCGEAIPSKVHSEGCNDVLEAGFAMDGLSCTDATSVKMLPSASTSLQGSLASCCSSSSEQQGLAQAMVDHELSRSSSTGKLHIQRDSHTVVAPQVVAETPQVSCDSEATTPLTCLATATPSSSSCVTRGSRCTWRAAANHHGSDAVSEDIDISAALVSAVQDGQAQLVKHLLSVRASPTAADSRGVTPLHTAVFDGHKDVCALLLEHMADPNACDKHGQPPLFFAPSAAICDLLSSFGASLLVRNCRGQSAKQLASHAGLHEVVTWFASRVPAEDRDVDSDHGTGNSSEHQGWHRKRANGANSEVAAAPVATTTATITAATQKHRQRSHSPSSPPVSGSCRAHWPSQRALSRGRLKEERARSPSRLCWRAGSVSDSTSSPSLSPTHLRSACLEDQCETELLSEMGNSHHEEHYITRPREERTCEQEGVLPAVRRASW